MHRATPAVAWVAALLISLTLTAAGSRAAAAPAAEDLELELRLRGALFHGEAPGEGDPSLLLLLRRVGGRWERVWAAARDYNCSCHWGRVTAADATDDRLTLDLNLTIQRDSWTRGGRALYRVTLERAGDDTYEGTFRGTFHACEVRGAATATVLPKRERGLGGRTPVEPGEHPRLLFRKADVPHLKKKMETPFGRACLARMRTAAGLALKYRLTSEERFAREARQAVEAHMADHSNGSKMVRSRVWGWRLEQVALAYDLCYDAWPADFRREVQDYLVWAARRLYLVKSLFHSEINWHMAARYPGTILYGAALAGLAVWGQPGPAPEPPPDPFRDHDPDRPIPPAEDYSPGQGVPVSDFASGRMPADWLYAGGFKPEDDLAPLAALGGPAKARPSVGTKVTCGDRTQPFRPLPHEPENKYFYKGQVSITDAADRIFYTTSYFYTVVRNGEPRWVRLRTGYRAATVYLAGRLLRDGDVARIGKGLYPMLVVASIGETNPWGKHLMQPRLVEVSETEAREVVARQRAEYHHQRADWQFDLAQRDRLGGAGTEYLKTFEHGRHLMYLVYREGIGTGGAQGTTEFPMGLEGPHKYAACYRTAFGTDVSPHPDVTHYLPRKVFAQVWRSDGSHLAQHLNGEPWLDITNVYHETRDLTSTMFAGLMPAIPERFRPAALWAWHRHLGTTKANRTERLLATPARPYDVEDTNAHAVYAFVNYPLDLAPRPPAEGMPLAWEAPGYGYYGFRSGWTGEDDFLVQVYAKARHPGAGGRENAGTFRVLGLGHTWSHGLEPPGRDRFGENVVLLPEDDINRSACGRVVHARTERDGSGVVTVDLADVYAGARRDDRGRAQALYERYGGVRRPSAFKDLGIRGLRSIGVDYSGKSGAPCLIAIADRITGGGPKTWAWQLESRIESGGKGEDYDRKTGTMVYDGKRIPYRPGAVVKEERKRLEASDLARTDGRAFTMKRGEAVLRGTFVAPRDVDLEFGERSRYRQTYKRGIQKVTSRAIFAEGGDAFLCVITIGRGDPPAVRIDGRGLDATATVGEQTVRFDGEKIVFGGGK
ncbi:MAG: hypothetical protein R6X20_18510 [Phycisphaerae bacterium]